MKTIHTYVCLVDNYRRPSRQRNTEGRYLVGAKSEDEAKELLQKAIKFGSIQVYYRTTDDEGQLKSDADILMDYKEIKKVRFDLPAGREPKTRLKPALSAIDSHK